MFDKNRLVLELMWCERFFFIMFKIFSIKVDFLGKGIVFRIYVKNKYLIENEWEVCWE